MNTTPEMPREWVKATELKERKEYIYNVSYKKALILLRKVDRNILRDTTDEMINMRGEIKEFLEQQ